MTRRCYACDRPMSDGPNNVLTSDGQPQRIGRECLKHVRLAAEAGWQPPLGGPRLYTVLPVRRFERIVDGVVERYVETLTYKTPQQD